MTQRFQRDTFDTPDVDFTQSFPPLPGWLADRLLRPGEGITWVVGPRFNPSWEEYVTHPGLFVVALGVGVIGWAGGSALAGPGTELPILLGIAAGCIVLGSIFVLGIFSGYFTRLVVTNRRLVIVQGREVCRSWNLNQLPRSLLRYSPHGPEEEAPAVDLDTLKTMLGGSSDKFAEAKTILSLGKRLDQIKAHENDRPRRG
jgi:hypothetical protein